MIFTVVDMLRPAHEHERNWLSKQRMELRTVEIILYFSLMI
jgi:hypothetical protein